MTLRCPDNWLTCDICGARPEQECQDPDRLEFLMGYKGMYKDEQPMASNGTVAAEAGTPTSAVSPHHYSRHAIEPIDFIELNGLGFAAGNVVKYVCRYDAKNGLEDLMKAKRYLEFLINKEKGIAPSLA